MFGKKSMPFPPGDSDASYDLRKKEKKTMKSTTSPYEPFQGFYPLTDVVDAYMEIWYKDSSSEEDSGWKMKYYKE